MKQITRLAVFFLSTLLSAGTVHAAELKLVASTGVKNVIEELSPAFERATGNKVQLLFQTAVPLKRRIDGGEQFDIVILPPTIVDDLTKEGKVESTTKGNFAKTGIGAAVKQGAQKPDISSVEALKKTLVQAKSIAYSKEGLSGTAMAGIIERLGLTKDLAQKTILETRVGGTPLNLIEGKADLAFALISEILPVQGIELVAPLPAELQTYVVFTSGLSSSSKAKAAAAAFIDFVKAPAALPVLKANGMEPG